MKFLMSMKFLSEPEITAFVIFGLGLTAQMAFRTLSRINFNSFTGLPRDVAMEYISDVAADELIEGIDQKLGVLCDKAGVPLPQEPYGFNHLMFNSGDGFDYIHFCYHDLLAHGLTSETFSYAMNVLAVLRAQGLDV